MPDLSKLYKSLKSDAPDYIKETEQDFVNKWKGSEDKLYDQLSEEVEGFKERASPRDEYVKLAKSSGGRGAGFLEQQTKKADTYTNEVAVSKLKPKSASKAPKNLGIYPFNSQDVVTDAPKNSGAKPPEFIVPDDNTSNAEIDPIIAHEKVKQKEKAEKLSALIDNPLLQSEDPVDPMEFGRNAINATSQESLYNDLAPDKKERGNYTIGMEALKTYADKANATIEGLEVLIDNKYGDGYLEDFYKQQAELYKVATANKNDKNAVKAYTDFLEDNKELIDSPEFNNILKLSDSFKKVKEHEERVKAENPNYVIRLNKLTTELFKKDLEEGNPLSNDFFGSFKFVGRKFMQAAGGTIKYLGDTIHSDSMREQGTIMEEDFADPSKWTRPMYENLVTDKDGTTYNVDKKTGKALYSIGKNGQQQPVTGDVYLDPSKAKETFNYLAPISQVADVAADFVFTSLITGGIGAGAKVTGGLLAKGLSAVDKAAKVAKWSKRGTELGQFVSTGLSIQSQVLERALREGATEDQALLSQVLAGTLYGLVGKVNPMESKTIQSILGGTVDDISIAAARNVSGGVTKLQAVKQGLLKLATEAGGENIEEGLLEPLADEISSYAQSKLTGKKYESQFPSDDELGQTAIVTTLFTALMAGPRIDFTKSKVLGNSVLSLMKDLPKSIEFLDRLKTSTGDPNLAKKAEELKSVLVEADKTGLPDKDKEKLALLIYNKSAKQSLLNSVGENAVTAYKYETDISNIDTSIKELLDKSSKPDEARTTETIKPTDTKTEGTAPAQSAEKSPEPKQGNYILKDDTHTTLTVRGTDGEATFRKTNKGNTWYSVEKDEQGNEVATKLPTTFVNEFIKPKFTEAQETAKKEEVVAREKEVSDYNEGKAKVIQSVDKSKVSEEEVTSVFDNIGDIIDEGTSAEEIKTVLDQANDKATVADKVRFIRQKLGKKLSDESLLTIKQMLSDSSKGTLGLMSLSDMVGFHEKNTEVRTKLTGTNSNKVTADFETKSQAELADLSKQKSELEQQRKGFLNKKSDSAKNKALELTTKIEELNTKIKNKTKELKDSKKSKEISEKLSNSNVPEVTDIDKINSEIAAVDAELSKVRADKKATITKDSEDYEPGTVSGKTDLLSAKERELNDRRAELDAQKKELGSEGEVENEMTSDPSYPDNAKPTTKKSTYGFKKGRVFKTPEGTYTYLGKSIDKDGRVFHTFKSDSNFNLKMYEDTHVKSLEYISSQKNAKASPEANTVLKKQVTFGKVKTYSNSVLIGLKKAIRSYRLKNLAKELNKAFPNVKISFDKGEMNKFLINEERTNAQREYNSIYAEWVDSSKKLIEYEAKLPKKITPKHIEELNRLKRALTVLDNALTEQKNIVNDMSDRLAKGQLKEFRPSDGATVKGFLHTASSTIYFDLESMDLETPVHEFGHVWLSYARAHYPELYLRGLQLVKGSKYDKEVRSNPGYAGLTEEELLDEALALAIGRKGLDIVNKTSAAKFASWFAELFNNISNALGFQSSTIKGKSIYDLSLSEFTNNVSKEMLSGDVVTQGSLVEAVKYGDKLFEGKFGTSIKKQVVYDVISSDDELLSVYKEISDLLPVDTDPNSKLLKLPSQMMHEFSDGDSIYKSQYEITQDIINSDLPDSIKDSYHNALNKYVQASRELSGETINSEKKALTAKETKELKSEIEREMVTDLASTNKLSPSKVLNDFYNWVATGIGNISKLVKNYGKIVGTAALLFINTPVSISEYKGPNDVLINKSFDNIYELFDRVNYDGSKVDDVVIDRVISLWTKLGKPVVFLDEKFDKNDGKDVRAYAYSAEVGTELGGISDYEEFIAEMAHAVQFYTDPNYDSKNFKYNKAENRDIIEYERVGSLEYDAHQIIEPIIGKYIFDGTGTAGATPQDLVDAAEDLGVGPIHFKNVVDLNKLNELLPEHVSRVQIPPRVVALKKSSTPSEINTANNPADLMDAYLQDRISKGLTPEYDVFVNDKNLLVHGINPSYIKARFENLRNESPQKAYEDIAEILNLPSLKEGDLSKAISVGNSIANRNITAKGTVINKGALNSKIEEDTTGFYNYLSEVSDNLNKKGYTTVLHDSFDSFVNEVDASGFDLSNALKNNVIILGNTVHILDKPSNNTNTSRISTGLQKQVSNFGVKSNMVEPVSTLINELFDNLKKEGLVSTETVSDWVGIGKGKEDVYSLKIGGEDVRVKEVSPEIVNGFYSNTEKALFQVKQEKMSGNQWTTQLLSRGANKEEMTWTGLDAFLKENAANSITKSDIQQFLKDNKISVVEVVKGSEGQISKVSDLPKEFTADGFVIRQDEDGWVRQREGGGQSEYIAPERALKYYNDEQGYREGNATKYSDKQLEGEKQNYKEILVTMPQSKSMQPFELKEGVGGNWYVENKKTGVKLLFGSEDLARSQYDKLSSEKQVDFDKTFKSSHWDEPNILVHLRMNTRVDAEGKKVLFLEEVQSDWGQKGKKEGFEITVKNKTEAIDAIKKGFQLMPYGKLPIRTENELNNYTGNFPLTANESNKNGFTPTAPFVTDTNAWTKLGLKVTLKEAVRQGASKIAWTTGEQQNDRYDLSKQVDEIGWQKNQNGTYNITPKKYGGVIGTQQIMGNLTIKQVEDYVGKDVAQKIENEEGKEWDGGDVKQGKLKGQQLKVGGKGMKGFYGSPTEGSLGIVGNVAKSLFKQEPKTVELQTTSTGIASQDKVLRLRDWVQKNKNEDYSYNDAQKDIENNSKLYQEYQKNIPTQHSIDITPELKASVEGGQPLFKKGDNFNVEKAEIIQKAKDNGTYHRAPNGSQSNLTEEQWVTVRTQSFKDWFGDWENDAENASKVVDDNGEPLVVYHGSPNFGFNEFLEKQGSKSKSKMQLLFGSHFATNKDDARIYARKKGGVYDLFLNIKTPIDLTMGFVEKGGTLFDNYLKLSKELNLSKYFKNNLDYDIFTKEGDYAGKSVEVQRVFITQYMLDKYAPNKTATALKNNGFDGVVYEPYKQQGFNTISKFSQSYITFYPNQIKSATANSGEFSSYSDNILYKDVQAQYRIDSGKNIIEAIKDFNGSPEAVVALTHEVMHPTVVAIFDGAKESNPTGLKYADTIISEYNKVNPEKQVTAEELIVDNDSFKSGTTTENYRSVQEFIAESWEKYHTEGGKGFSKAFQDVLNQIKEAFKAVFQSISGTEISPELRKMFDELLGKREVDNLISDSGSKLLNDQESAKLQAEIESNYNTNGIGFGPNNNDIRTSLFNYDSPIAQKTVNGTDIRITDGLKRKNEYGEIKKTYLLYTNGKVRGEFYSVNEAKEAVKDIENKPSKPTSTKENLKKELNIKVTGLKMSNNPKNFVGIAEVLLDQDIDKGVIQNVVASDEFINSLKKFKNLSETKKLDILNKINSVAETPIDMEQLPDMVNELVRLAEKSKDIPLPFVNDGEVEYPRVSLKKQSVGGKGNKNKIQRGDPKIDKINSVINNHPNIPPSVWKAILSSPDANGEIPLTGRALDEIIQNATHRYKVNIDNKRSVSSSKAKANLAKSQEMSDLFSFHSGVVESNRILTQEFLKEVADVAEEGDLQLTESGRFPDVGKDVPKFTFLEVLGDVRRKGQHEVGTALETTDKIEKNAPVTKSEVLGLGFALANVRRSMDSLNDMLDDDKLNDSQRNSILSDLAVWKLQYRRMHNAFMRIGSETGGMLAIFRKKVIDIALDDPFFLKNTLTNDTRIKNNPKAVKEISLAADEVSLAEAEVEALASKGTVSSIVAKTSEEVFNEISEGLKKGNLKIDKSVDDAVDELIAVISGTDTVEATREVINKGTELKKSVSYNTNSQVNKQSAKFSATIYNLGVALMQQHPNRILTFEDLTELIQTKLGNYGKQVTAEDVRIAFASPHQDIRTRTIDIHKQELSDIKKQSKILDKLSQLLEGLVLDKSTVTINGIVYYQVPVSPDSYVNKWVKSEMVSNQIQVIDANEDEKKEIQKKVNEIGVTINDSVHTSGIDKLFIRVNDPTGLGNYWADKVTLQPATETEKVLIANQIKKDTSPSRLGTPSLHKSAVIMDANGDKQLFVITKEGKWVTTKNPITNELREADPAEINDIQISLEKKGPYSDIQKYLIQLLKNSTSMDMLMGTAEQAAFVNNITAIRDELPNSLSGVAIDSFVVQKMLARVSEMRTLANLDRLENTIKEVEDKIKTLNEGSNEKAILEILDKARTDQKPYESKEVSLAKQRLREAKGRLNKLVAFHTKDDKGKYLKWFRLFTQTFKSLPASLDFSAVLIQGILTHGNLYRFDIENGVKSVLKGGPMSDFISPLQRTTYKGLKLVYKSFGPNGLQKAANFYEEMVNHPDYPKMVKAGLGISDPTSADNASEDLFREDLLDVTNDWVVKQIDKNLTGFANTASKAVSTVATMHWAKSRSEASYLSYLNAQRFGMFLNYLNAQRRLGKPVDDISMELAARSINDLTMKSSKIGSLDLNKPLEVAGYFLWAPKMYLAATKFLPNLLYKPVKSFIASSNTKKSRKELATLGKTKNALENTGTRSAEEQNLVDTYKNSNLRYAQQSDAGLLTLLKEDINTLKAKETAQTAEANALAYAAREHAYSLISLVALNTAVYAMLKRFCKDPESVKVASDITRGDFGKVGCGGILRDYTGNLSGYIRTAAQFIEKFTYGQGSSPNVEGSSYYNQKDAADVLYNFYISKSNPSAAIIMYLTINKGFYGDPVHRPILGADDVPGALGDVFGYSLSNVAPLFTREIFNKTYLDNVATLKDDQIVRAIAYPTTMLITAMGASLKEENTYDIKSVVKKDAGKLGIPMGSKDDAINFEPPSINAITTWESEEAKLKLNKDNFYYNKCKDIIINTAEPFIREKLADKDLRNSPESLGTLIKERVDGIKESAEQYLKNDGAEWGYEVVWRKKALELYPDNPHLQAFKKNTEKGMFPGDKGWIAKIFNTNNIEGLGPKDIQAITNAAREEMKAKGFVKYGAKPVPTKIKLNL